MGSGGFPDYDKLRRARRPLARMVLGLLLKYGRPLSFSEIQRELGVPPRRKSTLYNNLDVLSRGGFIVKEGRGAIRLRFKTPLCFIADTPGVPYAYLGLLGVRGERRSSETETAIRLLEEELGAKFKKVVVLTTQKAVGSWNGVMSPDVQERIEWRTMDEGRLSRVEAVEEAARQMVAELAHDYILIMDCTSGPRPAGIAFYKVASQLKIPVVYVYEPERKLIWLISKDMLRQELGGLFTIA